MIHFSLALLGFFNCAEPELFNFTDYYWTDTEEVAITKLIKADACKLYFQQDVCIAKVEKYGKDSYNIVCGSPLK